MSLIAWQFEHFKTFTPYEIMQQAAAALLLFEGESTDGTNPKMARLTEELTVNTGHPAWMPARETGNLHINTEGSVFRNKARLFSAFFICVPPDLLKTEGYGKQIMLTGFGRALAEGKVSEDEFYRFIVKKFEFPHLAYSDYDDWVASGCRVRPLVIILKALVALYEKGGRNSEYITSAEIYKWLQVLPNENVSEAVNGILASRQSESNDTYSSDQLRKINEMLAFLAIGGFIYIDSTGGEDRYWLNLVSRHPKEKTLFYLQRTAGGAGTGTSKTKSNVIESLKSIWEE